MEWVEVAAKTLEQAKEAALEQLGVGEADAEFEVLSEARGGLFGLARSEARVRARVRPTTPRPKESRRDKRRRPRARAAIAAPEQSDRQREEAGASSAAEGADGSKHESTRRRRSRARNRRSGEQMEDVQEPTQDAGPVDQQAARDRQSNSPVEVPLAEQVDLGVSFLEGLLRSFGLAASVEWSKLEESTAEIRVEGDHLGLLIGPRGSTLSAVQDLTRTVVQRQSGARTGRILVDVGGYRQKRKSALERFTGQVAERVLASGEEEVLEPMIPPDRKVVHDTINPIPGLVTRSEGEEPRRCVVVAPDRS